MRGKWPILLTGLVLLSVVAATSSLITAWVMRTAETSRSADFHDYIHAELGMTDAQEKRLLPSEKRYEETKRHLTEVIRQSNQELARAIQQERANSSRVQAAVKSIHEAQGQLQEETLEHIFEMKEVIEPAQYERLIDLTQQALRRQGGDE